MKLEEFRRALRASHLFQAAAELKEMGYPETAALVRSLGHEVAAGREKPGPVNVEQARRLSALQ